MRDPGKEVVKDNLFHTFKCLKAYRLSWTILKNEQNYLLQKPLKKHTDVFIHLFDINCPRVGSQLLKAMLTSMH